MSDITILSQSAVKEVITRIQTNAKQLQADIHQCAVSVLDHTREFGDYRGAVALLNALPSGQRVQGLVVWFQHFSGGALSFKKGEDKMWVGKLKAERSDADFDVAAAMLVTYGDFTKEAKPAVFTVEKLIKMLTDKANNAELNDDGSPKVEPAARNIASKLVQHYRELVSAVA